MDIAAIIPSELDKTRGKRAPCISVRSDDYVRPISLGHCVEATLHAPKLPHAMNVPRQPPTRLVRILSSELDDDLRECLSGFVQEAAGEGISVATLIPRTIHETDLLETAASQHWDFAMLFLNNINYSSKDRSASAIVRDAGNLIRKMKQLFNKPILCFFDWPDGPDMMRVALEAGAIGVFRVPCSSEDVLPTLRRCLDEMRGL